MAERTDNEASKKGGSRFSCIWGIAKSPELALDTENLYALIYRETGREHMNDLTPAEISHVMKVLRSMKGEAKVKNADKAEQKRTDVGGNPKTIKMRRKIYMLTKTLGWNNDNSRINAFAKKMCGVERIEWLSIRQCSDVIEGLKKMIERQEAGESAEGAGV